MAEAIPYYVNTGQLDLPDLKHCLSGSQLVNTCYQGTVLCFAFVPIQPVNMRLIFSLCQHHMAI